MTFVNFNRRYPKKKDPGSMNVWANEISLKHWKRPFLLKGPDEHCRRSIFTLTSLFSSSVLMNIVLMPPLHAHGWLIAGRLTMHASTIKLSQSWLREVSQTFTDSTDESSVVTSGSPSRWALMIPRHLSFRRFTIAHNSQVLLVTQVLSHNLATCQLASRVSHVRFLFRDRGAPCESVLSER